MSLDSGVESYKARLQTLETKLLRIMAKKLNQTLLAKRYAEALFELAQDAKALKEVESGFADLAEAVRESGHLRQAFSSPVVSNDALIGVVTSLAEKAGLHPLLANFLRLLAKNRRLAQIGVIEQTFSRLAMDARGELLAKVKVAKKLDKEAKDALAKALSGAASGKIKIQEQVDPSILGGLSIQMGSTLLDASLGGKLERLQLELKNPAKAA